jgi:hypothetical protein
VIQIGIVEERAAADEIATKVAHQALDFTFGLRAIRTTGARGEGHSRSALQRARQDLQVVATNTNTVPRKTVWSLPSAPQQPQQPVVPGF